MEAGRVRDSGLKDKQGGGHAGLLLMVGCVCHLPMIAALLYVHPSAMPRLSFCIQAIHGLDKGPWFLYV